MLTEIDFNSTNDNFQFFITYKMFRNSVVCNNLEQCILSFYFWKNRYKYYWQLLIHSNYTLRADALNIMLIVICIDCLGKSKKHV